MKSVLSDFRVLCKLHSSLANLAIRGIAMLLIRKTYTLLFGVSVEKQQKKKETLYEDLGRL